MFHKKFFPQSPANIQTNNKVRDEDIENFSTVEQSDSTHSTERLNAAEINPKARDPDQSMYSRPC